MKFENFAKKIFRKFGNPTSNYLGKGFIYNFIVVVTDKPFSSNLRIRNVNFFIYLTCIKKNNEKFQLHKSDEGWTNFPFISTYLASLVLVDLNSLVVQVQSVVGMALDSGYSHDTLAILGEITKRPDEHSYTPSCSISFGAKLL